jgi:hypothetical protein
MPIAVVRRTTDSWPLKVSLDSRSTLDPARTLGSVPKVEVEARLAADASDVKPSPDDLVASAVLATGGAVAASLTIDRRRR